MDNYTEIWSAGVETSPKRLSDSFLQEYKDATMLQEILIKIKRL